MFEYGATYILFNLLHFDLQLNLIVVRISVFKIISLTLVLIANYIASKIFVFRNDQAKKESWAFEIWIVQNRTNVFLFSQTFAHLRTVGIMGGGTS